MQTKTNNEEWKGHRNYHRKTNQALKELKYIQAWIIKIAFNKKAFNNLKNYSTHWKVPVVTYVIQLRVIIMLQNAVCEIYLIS